MDEPPLFASDATEPIAPTPAPVTPGPGPAEPAPIPAAPAPVEPPLYVPPSPAAPLDWSGGPSSDASLSGTTAEPPVRWDTPPDRGGIAVPGAPDLIYAGTVARLVAFIIDSFILGVVGVVGAVLIVGVLGQGSVPTAVATTALVLLELVYFVVLWTGRRRATFGMRLLKLQIGNAMDGRTVTRERAVRRWLAYGQWLYLLAIVPALANLGNVLALVWSVVLLVSVASNAIHQGLHDTFAGTAIVQPRGSSNGLLVGCIVIVGVLGLSMFVGIVALIFLGSQISGIQTTP